MPIRIESDRPGLQGAWIDFRDDKWRFGDRNKILNSSSDLDTLTIVLDYIVAWDLKDVDGKKIKFEPTVTETVGEGDDAEEITRPNLELFDNMDELVASWVINAWFEAKNSRMEVPKES